MSDPFSPTTRSEIIREAQIGLTAVAVVLSLFLYVAYYKITGQGRELPDHILNAPVAETVWPGGPPRENSLVNNLDNQFKSSDGLQTKKLTDPSNTFENRFPDSFNPATSQPRAASLPSQLPLDATRLRQPRERLSSTKHFEASDLTNAFEPQVKLASAETDVNDKNQFAPAQSSSGLKLDPTVQSPTTQSTRVAPAKSGPSNQFSPLPSGPDAFGLAAEDGPGVLRQGLPKRIGENGQPLKGNVVSRLELPISFGKFDPAEKVIERSDTDLKNKQNSISVLQSTRPPLAPEKPRVITMPKSSALDLVGSPDSRVDFSSKPIDIESKRPSTKNQVDRARDPSLGTDLRDRRIQGRDSDLRGALVQSNAQRLSSSPPLFQPPSQIPDNTFSSSPSQLSETQSQAAPPKMRSPRAVEGWESTSLGPLRFERENQDTQDNKSNVSRSTFDESLNRSIDGFEGVNSNVIRASSEGVDSRYEGSPSEGTSKVLNSRNYVIQSGDSFWSISESAYGDGRFFRALYKYNAPTAPDFDNPPEGVSIGTPPKEDLISLWPDLCPKPDSKLTTAGGNQAYTTQEGDTLFDIARRKLGQASRYAEIFELNKTQFTSQSVAFAKLPAGVRLVLPAQ